MKKALIIALMCIIAGGMASAKVKKTQEKKQEPVVHKQYNSYRGLVMAGYQGWFSAEGDGSGNGWSTGLGDTSHDRCFMDFWPDTREYEKLYPTKFKMSDGSPAMMYSPYDLSTVDLHFKWMKEYGVDGVFMQRFINSHKEEKSYGARSIKVWDNAVKSAMKYDRAICMMYDLSGCHSATMCDYVFSDIDDVAEKYNLFDHDKFPSYLYHNGKPLVVLWGYGFVDREGYDLNDARKMVQGLKDRGYSVMLGVPTYWRTLDRDTRNDKALHEVIRMADIVMPWFVGRYDDKTYQSFAPLIDEDIKWAKANGIDYAPLCYPGFSWYNMDPNADDTVDRNSGRFYWEQLSYCISHGAEMIYVAMYDEMNEGTAIFKCAKNVPVPTEHAKFVPIDDDVETDHYLWLTGKAAAMLKALTSKVPER